MDMVRKIELLLLAVILIVLTVGGIMAVRGLARLPDLAIEQFKEVYGSAIQGLREELSRAYASVSDLTSQSRAAESEIALLGKELRLSGRRVIELEILATSNATEIRGLIADLESDDDLYARGARIIAESKEVFERDWPPQMD